MQLECQCIVQGNRFCKCLKHEMTNSAITQVKFVAQQYIQPQINKMCTLILLTNLAEPEWISINCHQKIIGDILCMVPRNVVTSTNISQQVDLVVFKNQCHLINGKCYFFSWGFQNDILGYQSLINARFPLINMEHIVTAINGEFPPFLSFNTLISYCKITNKWKFQKVIEPHIGLHVFLLSGQSYKKYRNVFQCKKDIFIAYAFVCDGKKDCPGNVAYDEMACTCKKNEILSNKCKYVVGKNGIKTCSLFYLTMKDGTCLLYTLVDIYNLKTTDSKLNFTSSFLTVEPIVFDSVSDLRCRDYGLLSCKYGHSNCYNIADICNYRLDENNLLTPCMSGEHIENCRNIHCNMKFKCQGFYCIPWSYVCDGKWDCPLRL